VNLMSDETKIYWEEQFAGLCGIHAINNLLQSPYFSEGDLAQIAKDLHEAERKLMAQLGTDTRDFLTFMAKESSHVDEAGNFSIEVIKRALETFFLNCVSVESDTIRDSKMDTVKEEGFICNLRNHWIALRKLGGKWYNLNSIQKDGPTFVSDMYLSLYLKQLNVEGYSIFVVKGTFPKLTVTIGGRGKCFHVQEIMERSKKKSQSKPTQRRIDAPPGSDLARAVQASLRDQADDEYKKVLRESAQEETRKQEKENYERALRESRRDLPSPSKDSDLEFALALSLATPPPKPQSSSTSIQQANPNNKPQTGSPSSDQDKDEDEQLKVALAMSLQKNTDSPWS